MPKKKKKSSKPISHLKKIQPQNSLFLFNRGAHLSNQSSFIWLQEEFDEMAGDNNRISLY